MLNQRKMDAPLFSFGLVTDVQYADVDDAPNFDKTVVRHYRNALEILKNGITEWKKRDLAFVVQLGDLFDGKAEMNKHPEEIPKKVTDLFNGLKTYHIIGNHELYNFTREQLDSLLNTTVDGKGHYTFSPHPGWRFIIVDSYQLNVMEKAKKDDAMKYLATKNPNDLEKEGVDWRTGLTGLDQRFLPYNGMVLQDQLQWLEQTMADVEKANEKAILLSHAPFVVGCSTQDTLIWNYEEILPIIEKYQKNIVACLFGHDHAGGYVRFNGIHCRTFEAPLEAPLGKDAYCILHVYNDKIKVEGFGTIGSSDWEL